VGTPHPRPPLSTPRGDGGRGEAATQAASRVIARASEL